MLGLSNFEVLTLACLLIIAITLISIVFLKSRELKLRRAEHAANFVTEFNSERIASAQASVGEFLRLKHESDYITLAILYDNRYRGIGIESDENIALTNAIVVLNFYEHIAQTIEVGVADEKYLRLYFRSVLLRSFQLYRPLIEMIREVSSVPNLYIAQEKLAHRWKLEYQNNILLRMLKARNQLR